MEREGGLINRKRVVAAVVLLLLVLLIIFLLWWWFWRGAGTQPAGPVTPTVEEKVILPPNKQIVTGQTPSPTAQPTAGELYVTNLARNFAERYGSFSTDRSFQNLRDVMPLSTQALRTKFQNTIAAGGNANTFKGMETHAVTITITSLTTTNGKVEVIAQRTETDADLNKKTTYQTLDLAVVKSGEFWYVDTASWRSN